MRVGGVAYRTIWVAEDARSVEIIDQTLLPHTLRWVHLDSLDAYCHAINVMQVRGAPLIGATAAWGMFLAMRDDNCDAALAELERRSKEGGNLLEAAVEAAQERNIEVGVLIRSPEFAEKLKEHFAIGDTPEEKEA